MTCKTQDVKRKLTRVFWNSECLKACEILQIIRLIVIRTFRDYSCPVTDELMFIPRRDFPRGKWWRVPEQSAFSNRKGMRGCKGQQQQQHYCNYYGYLPEPASWLVSWLYWMARGLKMDDTCHDVLFVLILVCRFISLVFKWHGSGSAWATCLSLGFWLLLSHFYLLFCLLHSRQWYNCDDSDKSVFHPR